MMINHYSGDKSITIFADLDAKKMTSQEINDLIEKKIQPEVNEKIQESLKKLFTFKK